MALIDDLVAYYSLDEASGSAIDAHDAFDLTDTNTVGSATGKIGNGRDFERDNAEYFTRATGGALQIETTDTSWTIAFWIKAETIAAGVPWGFGTASMGPLIYLASGVVHAYNAATGNDLSGGTISAGTWAFVMSWYEDATGERGIRVDGSEATHSVIGPSATTGSFNLGRYEGGDHIDAVLDECGFWKRALTSDERTELYNAGAGRDYAYISGGGGVVIPTLDQGMLTGGLATLGGGLA